jgi:hemolysin activation/secretion protein
MLLKRKLSALLLVAAMPGTLAAQPAEPVQPRTGPQAEPPQRPPYLAPGAPALVTAPAAETVSPATESGVTLREIKVVASQAGPDDQAAPPAGWHPVQEPLSGLRIDHRAGEPLNAAWVRRQFTANRVRDAGRAVALTQLINRAFLSAGFVNSGLLVQPDTSRDVLTLELIHGRLAARAGERPVEVRFVGDPHGLTPGFVGDRMPSARRQPVNAALIERDFRLLAEDPAIRTVNAQLRPGERPGEASLLLTILPEDRVDLYFSAGNSRSPSVGGERGAAGMRILNLFAGGDALFAEAGVTQGGPDITAGYSMPTFDPATILNLRASYNQAAVVDAPLVPLDIRSHERTFEMSLVRTLLRTPLTPAGEGRWSPSQTLTAGLGYVSRRQESFLLGQPFSFAPGSVDGRSEYGALRLLGDYVLRGVNQVFAASATGTIGLAGTRSIISGVLNPDRNFLALLVQLNYARRLSRDGLELRARFTGQLASSVLYSGERLAIGGEASVRGYRETLLLGDQGAIASVELAQPFSLFGAAGRARAFDWGSFSIAAFADAGYANSRTPAQPAPDTIASAGLSLSWRPSEALQLSVSYGDAFMHVVTTGSRDLQDDGVHIRLTIHPLRLFRAR